MLALTNILILMLVLTSLGVPSCNGQKNTYRISASIAAGRVGRRPHIVPHYTTAQQIVDDAISRLLRELEGLRYDVDNLKSQNTELAKFKRRLRAILRRDRALLNVQRNYMEEEWRKLEQEKRKLKEERKKLERMAEMVITAIDAINKHQDDRKKWGQRETEKEFSNEGDEDAKKETELVESPRSADEDQVESDLKRALKEERKKMEMEKGKVQKRWEDLNSLVEAVDRVLKQKRENIEILKSKIEEYQRSDRKLSNDEENDKKQLEQRVMEENELIDYMEHHLMEHKTKLQAFGQMGNGERDDAK